MPEPSGYPALATPGVPPPALPSTGELFAALLPRETFTVDPVLECGLSGLERWSPRLRVDPDPEWSVATILKATAPMRYLADPDGAFIDEAPMVVRVFRLPEPSLNPVVTPVPILSRLRMLHRRLGVGDDAVGADWYELGGRPAVLDLFGSDDAVSAFSLAAELSPDVGLLALGWGPPARSDALTDVAIPLAAIAAPDGEGLVWRLPPTWDRREELQLTTDALQAFVNLRPLWPGSDAEDWTDQFFSEAPFLRDLRSLGTRDVTVPGVTDARLHRFDWQPSGRGRLLTTVVTGLAGELGFSFVFEVPLESEEEILLTSPDTILSWVSVLPDR